MKRFLFLAVNALFLVAASSGTAAAQKKLTDGSILYDITITTGSDKGGASDFFNGATNAVYIKGAKVRTDMVNSLGTQSIIINATGSNHAAVIVKEYGEQKHIINLQPADWADANKKFQNVTFAYDEAATKTIQGYVAKKAVGSLPDGTTFTVWYTPDITVENKDFQYAARNLPGLALEYETTFGNTKVLYTASKISFMPVPPAKFELPKSGFRVMTYQESKGEKRPKAGA